MIQRSFARWQSLAVRRGTRFTVYVSKLITILKWLLLLLTTDVDGYSHHGHSLKHQSCRNDSSIAKLSRCCVVDVVQRTHDQVFFYRPQLCYSATVLQSVRPTYADGFVITKDHRIMHISIFETNCHTVDHKCDVYVGGKVRVAKFMIFLDLQHRGSK